MPDNTFLQQYIRDIPDFPAPGILFRDITPLLAAPEAFRRAVDDIVPLVRKDISHIAAIEARGFIFAAAVAYQLQLPFVPIRKPGKLPAATVGVEYQLEYGTDSLEMHADALPAGAGVCLLDDLIATGGTLAAARQLVEKNGGAVLQIVCLIELQALGGRSRLPDVPVESLLVY